VARGPSPTDQITQVFQHYADRGVFRAFAHVKRGAYRLYRFTWLTRQPFTARFSATRTKGLLTFPRLLPDMHADSALARELVHLVNSRVSPGQPAHKRMDPRRAKAYGRVEKRAFTLAIEVRRGHHEYGVRQALNLVNDLFLLMHETYPDYLAEHFGMSTE
jgi:hypothetical protein